MEELFRSFADTVALAVEVAAVVIVGVGALEAAIRLIGRMLRRSTTHGERKEIWRSFGMWLVLGLEFELAADIVRSVIAPSWTDIGRLAAVAVIRTFLNYFLEKDLEETGEGRGKPTPTARTREAPG